MNYERLYYNIVRTARDRKTPSGYFESHHVVPRSLGGSDDPENLVNVTAREHFILHYLLTKFHNGADKIKMLHAFMLMSGGNDRQHRYINGRLYEAKKSDFAKAQRDRFSGVPKTEEHKRKISESLKGRTTSEATKKKQSESASKRKRKQFSPEYKEAMSLRMKKIKNKKGL
ncbi:putative homing endonuclease [Pseudomonas phage Henu5]|uniref:Putative homing endonuclease n=1 Tax=Pseudomonas phage Henu5 TaxID=2499902 RepID=A0A410T8E2_9CAUD|nr:putative homing endonuclease [Pseudomonas phage Henu5]QAU05129.1 putative homing endonuclease [Pseudomonas phage Henu5]